MGLTFNMAYFFSVKPQVCNAGVNCSNPNFILCKIVFVFPVTVNIVNSISRPVVNIIVLSKGPSGLITKIKFKKKYFIELLRIITCGFEMETIR